MTPRHLHPGLWLAALLAAGCGGQRVSGDGGPTRLQHPALDPFAGPAAGYDGGCAVPAGAGREDTSSPDTVIGSGTPGSCRGDDVIAAVDRGGVITFDCGPDPVTITLGRTAKVKNTSARVVIDGGGQVALSGGGTTRILYQDTCDPAQIWTTDHCQDQATPLLVLQDLTLVDGDATGQLEEGGGGGAVLARGGQLKIVGARFFGNYCDTSGPDLGGGAVRVLSMDHPGRPAFIVGSTFGGAEGYRNLCANGGAVSALHASVQVVNSRFGYDEALGYGANPARPGTPGGGNGGEVYGDGTAFDFGFCGVLLEHGHAREGGGALFYVSNDGTGTLSVRDAVVRASVSDGGWDNYPGMFVLTDAAPDFTGTTFE